MNRVQKDPRTWTFADEIVNEAGGEEIIAAAVGHYGWCYGRCDDAYGTDGGLRQCPGDDILGMALDWDEVAPLLSYQVDHGYGAPECHAVTVWTTDRVLFVTQYDGSTAINSVPRSPGSDRHDVPMPGG